MANLSIRKLDESVYKKLQYRAKLHAVSMEEEARRLITQAVMPSESISDTFKEFFGPRHGIELPDLDQRKPHTPIQLGDSE